MVLRICSGAMEYKTTAFAHPTSSSRAHHQSHLSCACCSCPGQPAPCPAGSRLSSRGLSAAAGPRVQSSSPVRPGAFLCTTWARSFAAPRPAQQEPALLPTCASVCCNTQGARQNDFDDNKWYSAMCHDIMRFLFMLGNLRHHCGLSREADWRLSRLGYQTGKILPGSKPAGLIFCPRPNSVADHPDDASHSGQWP